MPIYAYKCASCGHAKDVLRRMSDDPLTVCPACGASTFEKQVTAAGFQLKGSGWYVTDFRGGNNAKAEPEGKGESTAKGAESAAPASGGDSAPAAKPGAAAPSPAPAAAPASAPAPATSTKPSTPST